MRRGGIRGVRELDDGDIGKGNQHSRFMIDDAVSWSSRHS